MMFSQTNALTPPINKGSSYKKWLTLLIIIITIYILYRLYKKRRELLISSEKNQYPSIKDDKETAEIMAAFKAAHEQKEGFSSDIAPESKIGSRNLPLTKYFIKASYNSCLQNQLFTSTLSITQLNSVIANGYRFLDFELCQIGDEIRICANSTYGDDTNQSTPQTVAFLDALESVSTKALVAGSSYIPYVSNYREPLFVHLRLKFTTVVDKTTFFNKIASAIQTKLSSYMLPAPATWSNLILNTVMNKGQNCFILLDITNISTDDMNLLNSSQLKSYIHGYTISGANANVGGNLFFYEDYTKDLEISSSSSKKTTESSQTIFSIVIPKAQYTSENPYPYDYARRYGMQIVTMNAALSDYGMQKNNSIFLGTGFVSMDVVVKNSIKDTRYYLLDDIKYGIFVSFSIIIVVGIAAMVYKSPSQKK